MKKNLILTAWVLLLTFALTACGVTFDGYSYNLEDARKSLANYKMHDYLFSAKYENKIIDIVINKNLLTIVEIDTRGEYPDMQYKITDVNTTYIDDLIAEEQEKESYYWIPMGLATVTVKWLIIDKEYNEAHDNYEGYEFTYNGESFVLCFKINAKDE